MGIYDNKKQALPKFGFSWKILKYPAIAIIAIIIILLAYLFLPQLFRQELIVAHLNLNPLDLAQQQTVVLTVDVFNTAGENASNALVSIDAIASEMFVITPSRMEIATLEAGGRREFLFQIRPFNKNNPGAGVPAGDYKIRIVFSLNEKEFSKEIVLQLKRAG